VTDVPSYADARIRARFKFLDIEFQIASFRPNKTGTWTLLHDRVCMHFDGMKAATKEEAAERYEAWLGAGYSNFAQLHEAINECRAHQGLGRLP
jgi:hypothetical protein